MRDFSITTIRAVTATANQFILYFGAVICLIAVMFVALLSSIAASPFGILLSNEAAEAGTMPLSAAVAAVQNEFTEKLELLQSADNYAAIYISGKPADFSEVVAVFAVHTTSNVEATSADVISIDDEKLESNQKIRKIIKKGVLNIELAGLSECVLNLEKDESKRKDLLIDIIKYVKDKCLKFTKETKMNFIVSETSKHRPLKKLMELDKSIYGIKKKITDKEHYSRIDNLFEFKSNKDEDLNYIGKYQSLLTGGNLVKVNLTKSAKQKDILGLIENLLSNNVGFIKFRGAKYDYDN
jgi:hypothetical protein